MSALLSCAFASKAWANDQLDVLEIDYTHFTLGTVRVISNKDYFRISSSDQHFDVISKGPDWSIVSYNRNNHLYNVNTVGSFISFIAQMNEGWLLKFPPDTTIVKTTYEGLPALRHTVLIKGRNLGWTKDFDDKTKISLEAFIYDGDMVPSPCAKIVNEMYDMHTIKKMFLALKLITLKGEPETRFRCKKSFRTTVPKAFFEVPKGYKKGTIAQVFGSAQSDSPAVRSLIDDMGLGRSFQP